MLGTTTANEPMTVTRCGWRLLMYSDKADQPAEGYKAYWCDSPQAMLQKLALHTGSGG